MDKPVAKSSMSIYRPVAEVFNAFVDPGVITKFWLAETTGPLAPDARVTWMFMVPGARDDVHVTAFEIDRHIAFDWSDGVSVNVFFESDAADATTVRVTAEGFKGAHETDAVVNATEGFTLVLCDLKTLLETGTSAGLVKAKAELIARSKQ